MKKAESQGRGRGARQKRRAASSRRSKAELVTEVENLSQARQKLEASNKRFENLYDVAPVGFITLTAEGTIREINLRAVRLLDHARKNILGTKFAEFVAEPDRRRFAEFLASCLKAVNPDRPLAVELELLPKGRPGPIFVELLAISTQDGQRQNTIVRCVFKDVTSIKHMQEVQRWLAAIVESSDDAIIGCDTEGRIISANRGAWELYGYRQPELIGASMLILIPVELRSREAKVIQRAARGETIVHYETVREHKSGSRIQVLLTISPIRDSQGRMLGFSKIARDITQRKVWEKELAESLAREQAANRAKDEFLAVLSHELRTPLSPVLLLASDYAQDHELPPRARAGFDAIRKNIELEARLIDDLLDMTGIIHGKLALNKTAAEVKDILNDAISTVGEELEQKQISLKMQTGTEAHKVFGDVVRLRQVFWNLIKNAVKFTPQGGQVTVQSGLTAKGTVLVTIADTGIGMDQQEMETIFDAFSQGRHGIGGLGLGLAISRALVESHSGSIRASSPGKGRGSTFFVELPSARAQKAEAKAPPLPPTPSPVPGQKKSSIHILLVEDHDATRRALTQLLSRHNYKVTNAASYEEGLSMIESGKHFDVLISDIGLPDGSGYHLMAQFRERFGARGIALTGYGTEQDVRRSREAGFTTHLTKPVRMEALETALAVTVNVPD